jgi:hypothetical protein
MGGIGRIRRRQGVNIAHLGDALDHWKGSMIEMLGDSLRDLHVVPMFTDNDPAACWTEVHLELYTRLLRVSRDRIMLCHTPFQQSNRRDYFSELRLPAEADVFLDPDTGIAPDGRGTAKHVRPQDLATVLPAGSRRIVLVYQHSSHSRDFVEKALRQVVDSPRLSGVGAIAYDAGTVAMIFAARHQPRLIELRKTMTRLFKGSSRVRMVD